MSNRDMVIELVSKVPENTPLQEIAREVEMLAGGSIQPLIANTARSEITQHRVTELEFILSDEFGGTE